MIFIDSLREILQASFNIIKRCKLSKPKQMSSPILHLCLRIKGREFNKHGKAGLLLGEPLCKSLLSSLSEHHSGTGVHQCTLVAGSVNCNVQGWVFRKAQNLSVPSVSSWGSPHTFLWGFYIFSDKATEKFSGGITYIIPSITYFLFLYNFVEKKMVAFASLLRLTTASKSYRVCALGSVVGGFSLLCPSA